VGLRFELKKKSKPPVSDVEYKDLKRLLHQAQKKAAKHHVFWDCDEDENKSDVKKKLQYVARQERIPLTIQSLSKRNALRLTFSVGQKPLGADQAREQVLDALRKSDVPLSRKEVLELTEVTPTSWSLSIKKLLEEGLVRRVGTKPQTKYDTVI
jgi:hypothetical protein